MCWCQIKVKSLEQSKNKLLKRYDEFEVLVLWIQKSALVVFGRK